jgi:hypothetical protein
MAELSFDALPYLVALSQDPDDRIQRAAREQIIIKRKKYVKLFEDRNWQGYNLPEQRAINIFHGVQ